MLGLVILLLAGDSLVRGAVNLSLRLGVPALIVSLTIVAFGTSAPELLIAVQAVLDDVPGLALGNVVGSNTANILKVLGIPALLATMHTSECETRRTYNFIIVASLVFIALAFRGVFDRIAAVVLLLGLGFVLYHSAREATGHRAACAAGTTEQDEIEGVDPSLPVWRIAVLLALGLVGMPLGADLLVNNATIIAATYGVSDTVIGLTLVAAFGGWTLGNRSLSATRASNAELAAKAKTALKEYHRNRRDGYRLDHLEAWAAVNPDWLEHVESIRAFIPDPSRVVLDDLSLALLSGGIDHDKGAGFSEVGEVRVEISGESIDRETIDGLRSELVAAENIQLKSNGSEKSGGRRLQVPFDFQLRTDVDVSSGSGGGS